MNISPPFHFIYEDAFDRALPGDRQEAFALETRIEAALLHGRTTPTGQLTIDGRRVKYRVAGRTIHLLTIE